MAGEYLCGIAGALGRAAEGLGAASSFLDAEASYPSNHSHTAAVSLIRIDETTSDSPADICLSLNFFNPH